LKKSVKEGQTAAGASSAQEAQAKLNEIIKDRNNKLATTPVFGSDVAQDKNLVVKNDVDLGDFIVKVNPKTIDVVSLTFLLHNHLLLVRKHQEQLLYPKSLFVLQTNTCGY
jgi:hypothetical protein